MVVVLLNLYIEHVGTMRPAHLSIPSGCHVEEGGISTTLSQSQPNSNKRFTKAAH